MHLTKALHLLRCHGKVIGKESGMREFAEDDEEVQVAARRIVIRGTGNELGTYAARNENFVQTSEYGIERF